MHLIANSRYKGTNIFQDAIFCVTTILFIFINMLLHITDYDRLSVCVPL